MLIIFSRSNTAASLAVRAATRGRGYDVGNGWSHCGAVLPSGEVIDSMLGQGVREPRSLRSYMLAFPQHAFAAVPRPLDGLVAEILLAERGKPYDYRALPHFVLPGWSGARDWADDGAWLCSELIAHALERVGHIEVPGDTCLVSPNALALMLGLAPASRESAIDGALLAPAV